MIISDGYNGTPTGFENFCEDEEGYTKWYVLHAEANAISKVASSTQSCKGGTLYITLSPCKECSKLIHQAGIIRVVFSEAYKDDSGIRFLEKAGIDVKLVSELD
jgi:dCMP deaminase